MFKFYAYDQFQLWILCGSSFFLDIIANSVTPIPITQNIKYGVSSPNDSVTGPPIIGPIAQPIPKTVSYAPIIFPEISFRVLRKQEELRRESIGFCVS